MKVKNEEVLRKSGSSSREKALRCGHVPKMHQWYGGEEAKVTEMLGEQAGMAGRDLCPDDSPRDECITAGNY